MKDIFALRQESVNSLAIVKILKVLNRGGLKTLPDIVHMTKLDMDDARKAMEYLKENGIVLELRYNGTRVYKLNETSQDLIDLLDLVSER